MRDVTHAQFCSNFPSSLPINFWCYCKKKLISSAEAELQALNLNWEQALRLAKDRQEWKKLVDTLISCAT